MHTLRRRLYGGPKYHPYLSLSSSLMAPLLYSSQRLSHRPYHPRRRQVLLLSNCNRATYDGSETRHTFYICQRLRGACKGRASHKPFSYTC